MVPKTKVSKDLGLGPDLTTASGRSPSRAMPKARLTYCLQLDRTRSKRTPPLVHYKMGGEVAEEHSARLNPGQVSRAANTKSFQKTLQALRPTQFPLTQIVAHIAGAAPKRTCSVA